MYRLYNPNSGEHFYTSNIAERDTLTGLGWRYEGIGWQAPSWSNTPVYRLYNRNGGEHHYTLNAGERDALVAAGIRMMRSRFLFTVSTTRISSRITTTIRRQSVRTTHSCLMAGVLKA